MVVHLIGIPITGTSVNPARGSGADPLIVGGIRARQVAALSVVPLVGGMVAATLHWLIFPADPRIAMHEQAGLADIRRAAFSSISVYRTAWRVVGCRSSSSA